MSYIGKLNFNGNIKLGSSIASWSTLMGNESYSINYNGNRYECTGTCGNHCIGCKTSCYVMTSYRYTNVIFSHIRNTLALRNHPDELERDIKLQLARRRKPVKAVRVGQSGEIEKKRDETVFANTAADFSNLPFFQYTKAYEIIVPMLLSGEIPKNYTILISIWGINGIEEYKKVCHLDNVKAFVYVDKFFTVEWYQKHGLKIDTFCGAYNANGKLDHNMTCDICTKCFNRLNSCKVIGCYDHSKKKK